MTRRTRRGRGKSNGCAGKRTEQQLEQNINARSLPEQDMCNSMHEGPKNTRGPTYMPEIWTRNSDDQRFTITCNKKGQPIGKNKNKLTGFLGTLARNGKFAPINIIDWREVPKARKDEMLDLIEERFDVPPGLNGWILSSIGKKWRAWKSRLRANYYTPDLPIDRQIQNRPARVLEDQWKEIVLYWNTEEAKKISEKNKEHRQSKTMNQTTGKLSFAEIYEELRESLRRSPSRVELFDVCYSDSNGNPSSEKVGDALAQMKEYQSQLPPGSLDLISPNDSFAKVIGKDPPGKVRMCGLGVNQSDAWGELPSRNTCHRMVLEQKAAMSRLEEKIDEQSRQITELQSRVLPENQQSTNSTSASIPTTTSPQQSSNLFNATRSFKIGNSVVLKSMFDLTKLVPKGILRSMDSTKDVGGQQLGANWCEVQVMVPIEWEEELIRPYSCLRTVGEALGTSIAWPIHLVANSED